MTVISEPISNIAGADNSTQFIFSSPILRDSSDDTGMITTLPTILRAVNGVLTTPNFDPGPMTVLIGQYAYYFILPDSDTPVRFWPLIEAGLPIPPAEVATAVVNGGGISRIQRIEQSAYEALTTPDPETFYVVVSG